MSHLCQSALMISIIDLISRVTNDGPISKPFFYSVTFMSGRLLTSYW